VSAAAYDYDDSGYVLCLLVCQRIESGGNNWKGGRYNKECVFDFQTQQVVELTLCCPAGRRYSSYIILIILFLDVSAMAPTWFIDVSYMTNIWLLDGSRIFPICSCMLPTGFPCTAHLLPIVRFLHASYMFPMCFLHGFFTVPTRFLYGSHMIIIAWCLRGSVS